MNTIKKLIILTGLITSISATSIQATPLYYTFEGEVSHMHGSSSKLSVGDHVTNVFLIDDEVTSEITSHDISYEMSHYGVEQTTEQTVDFFNYNFYTELVFATGLEIDEGLTGEHTNGALGGLLIFMNDPTSPYFEDNRYEYGALSGIGSNGRVNIYFDSQLTRTDITSPPYLSSWSSKRIGSGDNTLFLPDDDGHGTIMVNSHLALTSISDTYTAPEHSTSVPEPSTFLLMGLSILGIGARRLKQLSL
jgi:hypothetical protein